MITAPETNQKAFLFPSFRFTLAAVILSNPGGVIPMKAEIKPKNKGVIKFICYGSGIKIGELFQMYWTAIL